jgi:hypothetical protein
MLTNTMFFILSRDIFPNAYLNYKENAREEDKTPRWCPFMLEEVPYRLAISIIAED